MQKRAKRLAQNIPTLQDHPGSSVQNWAQTFHSTGVLKKKKNHTNPNSRNSKRNTCQLCWYNWQVAEVITRASPNIPLSWEQEEWTPLPPCDRWSHVTSSDQCLMSRRQMSRSEALMAGMRFSTSFFPSCTQHHSSGSLSEENAELILQDKYHG